MHLILIAWLYVTLLMGVAQAAAPQGTIFGGLLTFVFYGLLPAALVGYILATPARKRALRARREAEQAAHEASQAREAAPSIGQPDAGGHAPAAPQAGGVTAVRKEP